MVSTGVPSKWAFVGYVDTVTGGSKNRRIEVDFRSVLVRPGVLLQGVIPANQSNSRVSTLRSRSPMYRSHCLSRPQVMLEALSWKLCRHDFRSTSHSRLGAHLGGNNWRLVESRPGSAMSTQLVLLSLPVTNMDPENCPWKACFCLYNPVVLGRFGVP